MSSTLRPVLVAVLLLVPSMAMGVSAQVPGGNTVTIAEGPVEWTPLHSKTLLYFTGGETDAGPGESVPHRMRTLPYREAGVGDTYDPRDPWYAQPYGSGRSTQYGITSEGGRGGETAVIRSEPLTHDLNVTGDNALAVHWEGSWIDGLQWTVRVREVTESGSRRNVGVEQFTAAGGSSPCSSGSAAACTVKVRLDENLDRRDGRPVFEKGGRIEITIQARATSLLSGVPLDRPGTWTLRTEDPGRPSYLEVHSRNAVKVATWTTDEEDAVKRFFRPTNDTTTDDENLLVGHFAVKTAFGSADYFAEPDGPRNALGRDLRFTATILDKQTGEPYPITLANLTNIPLEQDTLRTDFDEGIIAFRFTDAWDYGVWPYPKGEFTLQVDTVLRPDDAQRQQAAGSAVWDFVVGSQGLALSTYADPVADVTETQSHEVASGGTTTFLVNVQNRGNVADNVTLHVDLERAEPAFGWQATVRGDNVFDGNRVHLGAGEERMVLVTVRAPVSAAVGDFSVFSVTARSSVDSSVTSAPFMLTSTVSERVRESVGIVYADEEVRVRGGAENDVTVYLWNRGTRPANLQMNLLDDGQDGWKVVLDQNGVESSTVNVAQVAPGDVAPVNVKVTRDALTGDGLAHTVTLNATLAAGEGPGMERDLTFRLYSVASFRMELMQGINENLRVLEMRCGPTQTTTGDASPDAARRDSVYNTYCPFGPGAASEVTGTWYRLWLTNTGDVEDRYDVTIVNPVESRSPTDPRDDAFNADRIRVGVRNMDGSFDARDNLRVAPRQTAEMYVWVPHEWDSGRYVPSTLNFGVRVESDLTGEVRLREAVAVGKTNSNANDAGLRAKVEAVERLDTYSRDTPYVDISKAKEDVVTRVVDLTGEPAVHTIRVTNGATFGTYHDQNGNASVRVWLSGVDQARRDGWNVSMRPVLGPEDSREMDTDENPWREVLWLDNRNPETRNAESFLDHEVQVRMVPPQNGTARALAHQAIVGTVNVGFGNSVHDTLELTTRVAPVPNLTLDVVRARELVHAGKQTALTLVLNNNGSIATTAELNARFDAPTDAASQWSLTPSAQNLNLTPYENQTLALLVGAPQGAAVGDQALINVTLSFPIDPSNPNGERRERYLDLTVEVRPSAQLDLVARETSLDIQPGDRATFLMDVLNRDDTQATDYRVEFSPLKGWTQSGPGGGRVAAGDAEQIAYLVEAPENVVSGRTYDTIVRVVDVDNEDNFALVSLRLNVVGGAPFPGVSAVRSEDLVDRGDSVRFEMNVRNLGSAEGRFPLEAAAQSSRWSVHVENADGEVIDSVRVAPNALERVFLVVTAPGSVTEGTVMPVSLTAFNPRGDVTSRSTVRAIIHDYGVDVTLESRRVDVIPGDAKEFRFTVTNTGNGNDTIALSPDLGGLTGWSTRLTAEHVILPPGGSTEVRLVVSTPREPLPSPRQYTLGVNAGSEGGAAAGLPKNDSAPFVVTVVNYRAFDVDGDGFLELVVDRNKRPSDGFEHFTEVFRDGFTTREIDNLSGRRDGLTTFLVESDEDGSHTGVANVYYDPNEVFTYRVRHTPDITGDGTPNYLLDTDNDGVVDVAWDSVTRSLWEVQVVQAYGGTREQFLIDTTGNGAPDRYFDPDGNDGRGLVTRTIPMEDGQYGIDTDGSGRAGKYYDASSGQVLDARVSNLGDFAMKYWYFFAMFLAVLVVFGGVLAKRRRLG